MINGNGTLNGNNASAISDYSDKITQTVNERMKKFHLVLDGKAEEARKDKIFYVLLIGDNLTDMHYIRVALERSKSNFELIVYNNSEDAFKYLNRQSPYAKMPVPDLIVLDLMLPSGNGKEILEYIKSHKHLSWIPLIALSDKAEENEHFAYENNVKTVLKKPFDIAAFLAAFVAINKFWFLMDRLPVTK